MNEKQQKLIEAVPEGPLREKLRELFESDYILKRIKRELTEEEQKKIGEEFLQTFVKLTTLYMNITTEMGREIMLVMQEHKKITEASKKEKK